MDQKTSDSKWEINRVSTPERIFDKMFHEMGHPFGIIIFGIDGQFKDKITQQFMDTMDAFKFEIHIKNDYLNIKFCHTLLFDEEHDAIIVTLNSTVSASCLERRNYAKYLRRAGAKSIIGVYVESQDPGYQNLDEHLAFSRLRSSPPTPADFDYLIKVSE